MTAAVSTGAVSSNIDRRSPRAVQLTRVVVLFATGMVITFSATMHEQLGFDVAVTALALGAIGLTHAIAWFAARKAGGAPVALLLAIAGIAAAVVLSLTQTTLGFAVTVAAWALASALLEFLGAVVRPGSRQDATIVGAAGILLALLSLLAREDQVAVLGFFGGYAVIVAVFLGISAFDGRGAAAPVVAPEATDSPS